MIQLLAGDCLDVLPTLAADSVQTVVTSPPYYALRSYLPDGHADKGREIGSEPTPDEYLATMVAVFREVRRVMRPDATCWINLGDSYNANQGSGFNANAGKPTASPRMSTGLAAKQLLMMPARLALALQADGWWLRSDIIWHKPNPMPESVTDRPTSAHEHVFLLTKRSKYYYDSDAVREASDEASGWAKERARGGNTWDYGREGYETARIGGMSGKETFANTGTRNLRNVWTIATAPYSDAHFATFPPSLAERCIRAGTSERGACSQCGAPWGRVTEGNGAATGVAYSDHSLDLQAGMSQPSPNKKGGSEWRKAQAADPIRTTGWASGCKCYQVPPELADRYMEAPKIVPCTVLDPFAGAGTTLLVADRLQRDAIGIELSPDYTRLAMQRCQDDAPLFTAFPPASDDTYDSCMRDLFRDAAD